MSVKYISNGNPNMLIWNPETKKMLCQFINGEFETDNKKAIQILDTVAAAERKDSLGNPLPPRISRADGAKAKAVALDHAPTAPEDMSVKQLKAYAKENEIDIPAKAKSKKDILGMIYGADESEVVTEETPPADDAGSELDDEVEGGEAEEVLEDMSIKQIKKYAKENKINLPRKAKGKTAILAVIAEAMAD